MPTTTATGGQPVVTDTPTGEPTASPTESPTPEPLPSSSFAERANGDWQAANVDARVLPDRGYPFSGLSGRLNVSLTTDGDIVTWWWPATESPEVLTCHGLLDGDVLHTPDDPENDLQRATELAGYALDALGAELFVAQLCGVTADVLPDGPITIDSFTNTYLSHGDWRVALGGDDLSQPATTLDMIINTELDGIPVVTTINWVR